ncbi:MAG: universal stress protein [Desulfatirhabdiaceae bacterium]
MEKIKKILFHTRFREMAFQSLESLLDLRAAGLKKIILTHIIPTDDVSFVPYGGFLKDEAERLVEEARIRFVDWQYMLTQNNVQSKIRVEVGQPNAKILSIAEEENVDWIVTGRKKRTAFEMVYVGSHLLDILRRSDKPVLMGKFNVEYQKNGNILTRTNDHMFTRPLLATDWSAPCEHARKHLLALRPIIESVLLVHVLDDRTTRGRNGSFMKNLETETREQLSAWSDWFKQNGIATQTHLSAGRPVSEIINLSRDYQATLLVLGRTGKDWFEEYWLGGVSHRVAEQSELPVLMIP